LYASNLSSPASLQPEVTDFSRQLNAPTGRHALSSDTEADACLGHRYAGEHSPVLETNRNKVMREVWPPTIAGPCRPVPKSPASSKPPSSTIS
jgi:hypothetical protein